MRSDMTTNQRFNLINIENTAQEALAGTLTLKSAIRRLQWELKDLAASAATAGTAASVPLAATPPSNHKGA
jgi:hypothetical protein